MDAENVEACKPCPPNANTSGTNATAIDLCICNRDYFDARVAGRLSHLHHQQTADPARWGLIALSSDPH